MGTAARMTRERAAANFLRLLQVTTISIVTRNLQEKKAKSKEKRMFKFVFEFSNQTVTVAGQFLWVKVGFSTPKKEKNT